MANPNIVNVSTINGATATASSTGSLAGTTPAVTVSLVNNTNATLVANAASSGTIVKLNSLVFANNSAAAVAVSASILRGANTFYVGSAISVPANSTLVMISKDTNIYLVEGDALQISTVTASAISAICSYDIIS